MYRKGLEKSEFSQFVELFTFSVKLKIQEFIQPPVKCVAASIFLYFAVLSPAITFGGLLGTGC